MGKVVLCESCDENNAEVIVTLTNMDSVVLDTIHLCIPCVRSGIACTGNALSV